MKVLSEFLHFSLKSRMTTFISTTHYQGQSTNQAPFFDGSYYTYWKSKMETLIQSIDFDLWILTIQGSYIPMRDVNGVKTPKTFEEYDEEDKRKLALNALVLSRCGIY